MHDSPLAGLAANSVCHVCVIVYHLSDCKVQRRDGK